MSNLYLLLTEDAATGGKKASWGPEGYYLAENGQHVCSLLSLDFLYLLLITQPQAWGELGAVIGAKAKAKGYLKTDAIISLSIEETLKIHPFAPILWASNSRSVASRARKELGWNPVAPALNETLDALIDAEAKVLGL